MKFMTFCALLSLFVLGACAQGYEKGVAGGSGSLGASCTSGSDCAAPLACGHTRDNHNDTVCTTEDTARCNDGEQNGGESDIDCGFSCRSATPPNLCSVDPRTGLPQRCGNNADCDGTHGYTCVNNYCATSTTFTCGSANCTSNQTCVSNVCQNNCSSQYPTGYCAAGYTCNGTSCVVQSQYTCSATNPGGTCPSGTSCVGGACQQQSTACSASNPTGTCQSGYACVSGACVQQACSAAYLNGFCPTGQACNGGRCVASSSSTLCGTSTTATSATCYGQPDQSGITPQSGPFPMSPGVQFCCPSGFDSSFTVPRGTVGTCYGGHSIAGSAFGQLTVASSYGCQI